MNKTVKIDVIQRICRIASEAICVQPMLNKNDRERLYNELVTRINPEIDMFDIPRLYIESYTPQDVLADAVNATGIPYYMLPAKLDVYANCTGMVFLQIEY